MRSTVDALLYWKVFNEYNFSNILEIGVYQGQTAGLMLESSNNIQSYTGVDIKLQLNNFNSIYNDYLVYTKFYEQPSEGMVFDRIYDFILIDGSHSYDGVLADLFAASRALSTDGVLAIDDYILPGVASAIETFKKTTDLIPFLQLEQTEFWHHPGTNRSQFLDNLITDPINNFIFLYNIDTGPNSVLKAKTLMLLTNELDFFDQALKFYDI